MEELVNAVLLIVIMAISFWGYLIHSVLCDIKTKLYELHNDLEDNDSSESKTEEED